MAEKTVVPMEINYRPSWLSWVGAAATCLNALGIDCELAEVAGYSGYAFHMAVHKDMCPSGPSMLNWSGLNWGINLLGRSAQSFVSGDCHTGEYICERTRAHCRQVFELASREIAAGRPCVLWGAYVPEFAVVYGIEDGKYLVKSVKGHCGEPEPPLAYDELDAPGGPYLLAMPTATNEERQREWRDRFAIGQAAQRLTMPSWIGDYSLGLKAYDRWIEAFKSDSFVTFGNSYNAQCYCEAKAFAHEFLMGVAKRQPPIAEMLKPAVEDYATVKAAMKRVAELFPFPGEKEVKDPQVIEQATAALKEAQAAETRAAEVLLKLAQLSVPTLKTEAAE